jgi:uncharacterized protein involved in outer membrane biogenesis
MRREAAMKILFKIGLIVIVILVIVIAVVRSRLDSMIKSAVENIGPRVTQTAVKLDGVNVSFLSGRGRISGLVIGNPEGFRTENAFKLAETRVHLDVGSVLSDRIVIDELVIDGPEVTYERGASGSNIDKIKKNVEEFSPSKAPKEPEDQSAARKKFQINRLVVKNGRIRLADNLLTGKTADVALPDIELRDIGKNSTGATVKEVASRIIGAIEADVVQAVASAAKNLAPDLEKAGETARKVGSQAGKAASDAVKDVRGVLGKK